jgi:2-dehydropantoate 2-reductase
MWKPHYDAKPPWQQLPDEPAAPDRNNLEPIEHLIVTESPQFVVPHLLALKHRLGQHSTVLLVTGNLGLMEEIIVKVFPIPSERPKFMLGEFTHQIKRPNRSREHGHGVGFQMLHHHIGNLFFTQTPLFSTNSSSRETLNQIGQEEPSQQTEYLTKTLLSAPRLSALELPPLDLHMRQLDAVAWRSVIRPLSAMMDAPNGALLSNFHLTRTMRLILAETSLVIRSLPELRGHPNAETRYGPDRLEALIKTRLLNDYHADSRTTIDVRQGVKTDIEYINGYICARAQQLGLKPFMNFMMQELVKGKSAMIRQQNNGVVEDIADVLVDEV